jgi:hypothetical protein
MNENYSPNEEETQNFSSEQLDQPKQWQPGDETHAEQKYKDIRQNINLTIDGQTLVKDGKEFVFDDEEKEQIRSLLDEAHLKDFDKSTNLESYIAVISAQLKNSTIVLDVANRILSSDKSTPERKAEHQAKKSAIEPQVTMLASVLSRLQSLNKPAVSQAPESTQQS